jgi:hypothetical protein
MEVRMNSRYLMAVVIILALSFLSPSVNYAGYNFTFYDYPEAGYTFGWGINNADVISGYYHEDPNLSSTTHGYLYDGTSFFNVDFPGASQSRSYGINDGGVLTGYYIDSSGAAHGFIFDGSNYTSFDVPGASDTYSYGINDSNKVVGTFDNGTTSGFVYDGANFSTFTYSGASSTEAYDINNDDTIVGRYWIWDNSQGKEVGHGFVYDGTTFTTIDYPSASETRLFGINDLGVIVGEYKDRLGVKHGFLYDGTSFTPLDVPGALRTAPMGINNAGKITGGYEDASGIWRGFVGVRTDDCSAEHIFCVPTEYPTIRSAVDAIADGADSIIRVAQGVYAEGAAIKITKSGTVIIEGGWDPTFTHQNTDPRLTVLDGSNSHRVLAIVPTSSVAANRVEVRNLTIQNGQIKNEGYGAGILISNNSSSTLSVLIENNIIRWNEVLEHGDGAIGLDTANTDITIKDNVIYGNSAHNDSGAIVFGIWSNGTVNADITGNVITDNIQNYGGSITIWPLSSNVTINADFNDNTISYNGYFRPDIFGTDRNLNDNFNDTFNDRWTQESGGWTVENKEYSVSANGLGIATRDASVTECGVIIETDFTTTPDMSSENAIIVFDYNGPSDFKYAAASVSGDHWELGYYNGTWNPVGTAIYEPIDSSRWYRMRVKIDGNTAELYINEGRDGSGFTKKTTAVFSSIGTGLIGLAASNSHTHFDNFWIMNGKGHGAIFVIGGLNFQNHMFNLNYIRNKITGNTGLKGAGIYYSLVGGAEANVTSYANEITENGKPCGAKSLTDMPGELQSSYGNGVLIAGPSLDLIHRGLNLTKLSTFTFTDDIITENSRGDIVIQGDPANRHKIKITVNGSTLSSNPPDSRIYGEERNYLSVDGIGSTANSAMLDLNVDVSTLQNFDQSWLTFNKSTNDFSSSMIYSASVNNTAPDGEVTFTIVGEGIFNGMLNRLFNATIVDSPTGRDQMGIKIMDSNWHTIYMETVAPIVAGDFFSNVTCNACAEYLGADADFDGYPAGDDCNDSDPDVHSGMTEVPGNGKDDDCDPDTPDSGSTTAFDDFNDGTSNVWKPVEGSGIWNVENGEYSGRSRWDIGLFALSTFDGVITTDSTVAEVDCSMKTNHPRQNCYIVFDFKSATDYKFAGADAYNDQWIIGHHDSTGFYIDQTSSEIIDVSRWYRLRVEISGNNVKLYADDDRDGSGYDLKAMHTFSTIGSGEIGLQTIESHTHFDNFLIITQSLSGCSDSDGDGYGFPASTECMYPDEDCDDGDASIHPGATEICDGIDNDCDGIYENTDGNIDVPVECPTVQSAVDVALNGDTVRIAAGTYRNGAQIEVIKSGTITIEGGWNADFTNQIKDFLVCPASNPCRIDNSCGTPESNPENYCYTVDPSRTVISGDRDGDSVKDHRVMYIRPKSGELTLSIKDLTIKDGIASNSYNNTHGGGIYAESAYHTLTLMLTNNHIVNNEAAGDGGGIAAEAKNGDIIVSAYNNSIEYNNSGNEKEGGGLIFLPYKGVIDVVMRDNFIGNNSAFQGAGIAFYSGYDGLVEGTLNAEVLQNTIVDNKAIYINDGLCEGSGGAIMAYVKSYDQEYNARHNGAYKLNIVLDRNIIQKNIAPWGAAIWATMDRHFLDPDGAMHIISSKNIIEYNNIPDSSVCNTDLSVRPGGGITFYIANATKSDNVSSFITCNDIIQNNYPLDFNIVSSYEQLNEKLFIYNINSSIGNVNRHCLDSEDMDIACDYNTGFLSDKIEQGSDIFNHVIDGFFDDFADNNNIGWAERSGEWTIENSEYSADVSQTDTFAISTYDSANSSLNTIVEVDIKGQPIDGGSNPGLFHSGLVIFDYQGPDDFKYIHANFGDSLWEIGHYLNGTWDTINTVYDSTMNMDKWYRLKVIIAGTSVSLYADDDRDGSGFDLKAAGVFDTIDSGPIGIGTIFSHFHFDNFTVSEGQQAVKVDDFNDKDDDGWIKSVKTTDEAQFWSVEEYPSGSGNFVYAMNPLYQDTWEYPIFSVMDGIYASNNMSIKVTAGEIGDNGFSNFRIVFAYDELNKKVYWAGANLGGGKWIMQECDILDYLYSCSPLVPPLSDTGLAVGREYNLQVILSNNEVVLYADGEEKLRAPFSVPENSNWKIGIGGVLNHAYFDDFAVNNLILSFQDSFDDGDNNGWTTVDNSGTWTVESGEYVSNCSTDETVAVTYLKNTHLKANTIIETDLTVKSACTSGNGSIVFDFAQDIEKNIIRYKYIKADIMNDKWVIGYFDGDKFNDEVTYSEPLESETLYRLKAVIEGEKVTLYVNKGAEFVKKIEHTFNSMGKGEIGLQTIESLAHFDNVRIVAY